MYRSIMYRAFRLTCMDKLGIESLAITDKYLYVNVSSSQYKSSTTSSLAPAPHFSDRVILVWEKHEKHMRIDCKVILAEVKCEVVLSRFV